MKLSQSGINPVQDSISSMSSSDQSFHVLALGIKY